ncbi:MAG: AbgT family transporter [Rhodococcus sp. (in: high G+C Gram-positive bacteria)]|nr:AbgT family transporter [Rhodococcus sp. (in: high G+C Gram-positive bacteria)]
MATRNPVDKLISGLERAGNRLPHPMFLFLYLFGIIAVGSSVAQWLGASVLVPGSDEPLVVRGLFSSDGLLWFLDSFVDNFISFPPLATVILIVTAVGVAERTGLINAAIIATFARVPKRLVPYVVAMLSCQAHIMSDVAMVVVPSLAALVFLKLGRNPIAGLVGSLACVAAGYAGGVLLGALDTLYLGISEKATEILPDVEVHTSLLMNYFYTAAAGIALGLLGGLIIDRVLEPRCPAPDLDHLNLVGGEDDQSLNLDPGQRRGLVAAGGALLALLVVLGVSWLWPGSPLQGEGGTLVPSPLLSAMVLVIFTAFVLMAVVYGVAAKTLTSKDQLPAMMTDALREVVPYVVFALVISQALALFTWSNVGAYLAVNLAAGLKAVHLTGFLALLLLVLLTCVLNLLITSGSALWSLIAPVFIPSFMLLDLSPAVTQAAFRIGDSVTQPLSPLNPMLILVLAMLQKYEPDAKLGTLIARSALFAAPFLFVWLLLLGMFYGFDLPLGPGASVHM